MSNARQVQDIFTAAIDAVRPYSMESGVQLMRIANDVPGEVYFPDLISWLRKKDPRCTYEYTAVHYSGQLGYTWVREVDVSFLNAETICFRDVIYNMKEYLYTPEYRIIASDMKYMVLWDMLNYNLVTLKLRT